MSFWNASSCGQPAATREYPWAAILYGNKGTLKLQPSTVSISNPVAADQNSRRGVDRIRPKNPKRRRRR